MDAGEKILEGTVVNHRKSLWVPGGILEGVEKEGQPARDGES